MLRPVTKCLQILVVFLAVVGNAQATFHLWQMTQVYSNADGTVQYIELVALAGSQQFLAGHTLTSTQGSTTHSYTFTTNLPSDTAMAGGDGGYGGYGGMMATSFKSMVIGTQGFAALGVVAPDYIVPNGFLFTTNGTINYAGSDIFSYASLPTDGSLALYRTGSTAMNSPTNFDGLMGTIVPPATTAVSYTDLWWNSSESGWGLNLNHQGNIIFGTLFTYDASGAPMWPVLARGDLQSDGSFSGPLYSTIGPAFNAVPWTTTTATPIGTMRVAFASASSGTLTYTVNGVSVIKSITRQLFSTPATCAFTTGDRTAATNYQDLWWNPNESGWGINLTHQGNIIFATLFTYDATGKATWFVLARADRTGPGAYSGPLYRTTGPMFNAAPWTATTATPVGNMSFVFTNGNAGTLTYDVNGVQVIKAIQREVFGSPMTQCQ
jgi:hypothetical protein